MKSSIEATVVVLLLASGMVLGQQKAGPPGVSTASVKPLTVAGQVSNDRKTLVTDIDSEWSVSNPEMLKGHEGRRVTVKCYVDTEKSRIQVLSVKKDPTEATYSARFDRR